MSEKESWPELRKLLEERLEVIADHALRDRDPETHLERLKTVSERLTAEHARLRAELPARLNHFLTQASYGKALEWLRGGGEGETERGGE